MEIYTVGFTQKSARQFFTLLRENGIRQLVDIRRKPSGQLAGFTKQGDLEYFLKELAGATYRHELLLAPSPELLSDYRAGKTSWDEYEVVFDGLMRERQVESAIDPAMFAEPTILLCSEATADQCHRRLVAEYLERHWGNVNITHL